MSIIHDGSSTPSLPYADRIRLVTSDKPFRWLGLGWRDFIAAPVASLCYGLLFVIIGFALTVGLWHAGGIFDFTACKRVHAAGSGADNRISGNQP